jgi:hypothetical protein
VYKVTNFSVHKISIISCLIFTFSIRTLLRGITFTRTRQQDSCSLLATFWQEDTCLLTATFWQHTSHLNAQQPDLRPSACKRSLTFLINVICHISYELLLTVFVLNIVKELETTSYCSNQQTRVYHKRQHGPLRNTPTHTTWTRTSRITHEIDDCMHTWHTVT